LSMITNSVVIDPQKNMLLQPERLVIVQNK
jgi:hypothetical protein